MTAMSVYLLNTTTFMVNRKLFVPPMPAPNTSPSNSPSFVAHIKQQTSAQIAQAIPGNLSKGTKQAIAGYLVNVAVDSAGNYVKNNPPKWQGPKQQNNNNNGTPKGGSMTVFQGSPMVSDTNVNYALSKAPNPKKITLNSNIKPNAYSNDYMNPVEGACSPLHVSGIRFQIPTSTTNPLSAYFTNTICFDIQTRAQANVGFGLDISNKLSTSQLVTAFNAAIYAFQVYFWYTSLLSYESDPRNKNAGMIFLRSTIDAQTLSDLTQLGRRLEDVAMPPRVVEWMRYMNGNFLSSDNQGSPLLKIFLSQGQLKAPSGTSTLPAAALSQLVSDANNTVFSLLRNSIPQWRVGKLYDCPPNPTFDRNFLTIFANLPSVNEPAATFVFSNSTTANTIAMPYNSFSNRLDGVAFAMGGIFNSTTGEYIPGLTNNAGADTLNRDTRLSYYSVSGTKAFYNVYSTPFLNASRQETTTFQNTTVLQPHLFGTDRIQNVTGEALLQSAQNTLDYLFNVASIPLKGNLSHFNRGSKQVGRI